MKKRVAFFATALMLGGMILGSASGSFATTDVTTGSGSMASHQNLSPEANKSVTLAYDDPFGPLIVQPLG